MSKHKRSLLTKKQRTILDAINEHVYVKDAALALGLSPRTVYNILYSLRNKYAAARIYVNTILAYRRKSPTLERVLTKRLPIEKLEREILG